jgi:CYTH domain-containing protein
MALEIERKFLIEKDLWYAVKKPAGTDIIQAYLVNEPGKIIRIRVTESDAFITIKGPTEKATRYEFEYPISREDTLKMMELFTVNKIEKIRYKIEYHDHLWEIDEFYGANDGLVIAEIELTSPDEPFDKPSWLGEEVTEDHRYYNSYLSEHPYTEW